MASQALPMQEETMMRKGPWLEEEDERLRAYVTLMGERRWDSLARVSGLRRSGKSCRLRWLNYLHPDLKHGPITSAEEHTILQLQQRWGNKWSKIARRLPGRTDNEIKNYWRSHLRKKTQAQEQEQEQEQQEKLQTKFGNTTMTPDDIVTQVNVFGTSDYAFAASPYENRIWDCISEAMPMPMHDEDTWLCNQASSIDEVECWAGLWNMHAWSNLI